MTADASEKHHPGHPSRPWYRRYPAALFLGALGLALITLPFTEELGAGALVKAVIGVFSTNILIARLVSLCSSAATPTSPQSQRPPAKP